MNPTFCVANEFIANIIAKDEHPDGTPVTAVATFTNYYDVQTVAQIEFVMFAVDPLTRIVNPPTSLGLIHGFGVNVGSTVWGFLSNLFGSSTFQLSAWIQLKNIFNITVQIIELKMDMYMKLAFSLHFSHLSSPLI